MQVEFRLTVKQPGYEIEYGYTAEWDQLPVVGDNICTDYDEMSEFEIEYVTQMIDGSVTVQLKDLEVSWYEHDSWGDWYDRWTPDNIGTFKVRSVNAFWFEGRYRPASCPFYKTEFYSQVM